MQYPARLPAYVLQAWHDLTCQSRMHGSGRELGSTPSRAQGIPGGCHWLRPHCYCSSRRTRQLLRATRPRSETRSVSAKPRCCRDRACWLHCCWLRLQMQGLLWPNSHRQCRTRPAGASGLCGYGPRAGTAAQLSPAAAPWCASSAHSRLTVSTDKAWHMAS